MKPSKRLQGIDEYYFSGKLAAIAKLNSDGKDVINLGIGNPDLPPHPDVIKILQAESAKSNAHGYQSYRGVSVLREAMSNWYKKWYDVELNAATEILPLAGSKEGILHICMAFLNKGDKVLVPDPGYPVYASAAKLAGGFPVSYSVERRENGKMKIKMDGKGPSGKIKIMFLNYPHMPTGELGSAERFATLIDFAKKNDILLIHDNPYSFILNNNPASIFSAPGAKDCALELNSLSKSHNMAGWRVGMVCGRSDLINEVLRFKSNMDSGMFLPVQLAAAHALKLDREWYAEMNLIYGERKRAVHDLIDQLGGTYQKDQAGLFVWARIPASYKDGFGLSDEVLDRARVFLVPGGIFGKKGMKFFRVSLCTPVERIRVAKERIATAF